MPNILSYIGKLNYAGVLAVYVGLGFAYLKIVSPHLKKKKEEDEKDFIDMLLPVPSLDMRLHNPFTPIPFHNNPELLFRYGNTNFHNYLNHNNINPQNYLYSEYYCTNQPGDNSYIYNWEEKNPVKRIPHK